MFALNNSVCSFTHGFRPMERQEQEELQAKLDEEAAISAELTFVECTVGTISHPPKNVGKDKNWDCKKTLAPSVYDRSVTCC